jgi:hypothetical protein
MKVGVEWRPRMAGRPKIGDRPATCSLLSSFPLHYLHLWDNVEGQWPHGLAARPPYLAGWPPLGSPIKGLPRGTFSFIPQAHKQHQIS